MSNESPDVPPNQPKVAAGPPARIEIDDYDVVNTTPMLPSSKADLLQLKGDVRLVAFIDMIHNIFMLFFAVNAAVTWHEYVTEMEKLKNGNNSDTNNPVTFEILKIIPYVVPDYWSLDRTQARTILGLRFKFFMYLMVLHAILSAFGIWMALRLRLGTDLPRISLFRLKNRGRRQSEDLALGWVCGNVGITLYTLLGIILSYKLVSITYGSMVAFLLSVRLASGLIVLQFFYKLNADIYEGKAVSSTARFESESDNNATKSSGGPVEGAHKNDEASTKDKGKFFLYHLPATIIICDRPSSNPPTNIHPLANFDL